MINRKDAKSNRAIYFCFGTVIFWLTIWICSLRRENQQEYKPFRYTENLEGPYSQQHEVARRNIEHSIYNLYYLMRDQFSKKSNDSEFVNFGEQVLEQTISLIAEFENFGSSIDNAAAWHKLELKKLTDFIQRRIYKLQHPESCTSARILICELNEINCGLGCLIHRVGYCLRFSTISNRTMIIKKDAKGWKYSEQGWEVVYKPVSNCTHQNIFEGKEGKIAQWKSIEQTDRVTMLIEANEKGVNKPEQVALSFPKQIADKLLTHHSNPPLFFGAQFFYYAIRLNQQLESMVNEAVAKIELHSGPIVGIQIRRTDKLANEAEFFSVDKYFEWAELWFRIQEKRNPTQPKLKRRVFIATDDIEAINAAKKRFPQYKIYANLKNAQTAQLETRYTDESLHGIIVDYEILAKCNYVVCTLSSNVGRLVYELMQVDKGDAANTLHSLDLSYYNHFQREQEFVAIDNHQERNDKEMDLKIGDTIRLSAYGDSNQWNGKSKGYINDYKKPKLYPSYKVQEKWRIVDYPLFAL